MSVVKTHVVDIFGSVRGRDQPIMKMDKAVKLVECLGEEVLGSDEYVFFDPFCKAGEILLATALMSTLYRKGKNLSSLDEVTKELYESNRYFALAPDKRHCDLSRRTFYGNERSHEMGNNENIKNGAYLSEDDGKLKKEKFQKELKSMLEHIKEKAGNKKIIAVGNTPSYQEDSGYGKSAKPIYNILLESIMETSCIDQFIFIIPSRWFSGGKGLDRFRKKIITSKKVKQIVYFENTDTILPTVDIRGGVCFLHWDRKNKGKTIINNGKEHKKIDLENYDIIVPHLEADSILSKIFKKQKKDEFLDQKVWPRNPFGLGTNFFKLNKEWSKGNVECLSRGKQINKISPKLIVKNHDKINHYKVAFPEANGGGKGKRYKILPRPKDFFILGKGQVSTETYSVAGSFENRKMAENYLTFLRSYLARFLLGLRKPTQHASQKTFAWIPLMDFEIEWDDKKLFDFFEITSAEEKYIREKVDYWT